MPAASADQFQLGEHPIGVVPPPHHSINLLPNFEEKKILTRHIFIEQIF
jgi:hypothetical protein